MYILDVTCLWTNGALMYQWKLFLDRIFAWGWNRHALKKSRWCCFHLCTVFWNQSMILYQQTVKAAQKSMMNKKHYTFEWRRLALSPDSSSSRLLPLNPEVDVKKSTLLCLTYRKELNKCKKKKKTHTTLFCPPTAVFFFILSFFFLLKCRPPGKGRIKWGVLLNRRRCNVWITRASGERWKLC